MKAMIENIKKTPTETLIANLENAVAYLELYAKAPDCYLLSLMYVGERTSVDHKLHQRYNVLFERCKMRNEALIRTDYLNQAIINLDPLNNPAYALLESDKAYHDALQDNFIPLRFSLFSKKTQTNGLDNRVSNTQVYLDAIQCVPAFIQLAEAVATMPEPKVDVNACILAMQSFDNQFIAPVEAMIEQYNQADAASKIAAYKVIAKPLKALYLAVYEKSVKLYPDAPKPSYYVEKPTTHEAASQKIQNNACVFFGAGLFAGLIGVALTASSVSANKL